MVNQINRFWFDHNAEGGSDEDNEEETNNESLRFPLMAVILIQAQMIIWIICA